MQQTPEKLEQYMQSCRAKSNVPEAMLRVVERVALWQWEHPVDPVSVPAVELTDADRHRQGVPLLPRAVFPVPEDGAARVESLMEALADSPLGETVSAMMGRVQRGELDLSAAVRAALLGDEAFFAPYAAQFPDAPRLVPFAVGSAVTPWAEAVARAALGEKDLTTPETVWPHGHCPVCGALPVVGDLRGKEGHRIHTCSFCHTPYRAPRLQCPFCLETAQGQLGFVDSPELPGFRLLTCSTCRMYIKVTDFREMDRTSWPAMDDLESMTLDLAAMEQGWRRPTLSAWGF